MKRVIEKVGFNLKKKAFKILKPQMVTTARILVNDKVVKEFFCESLTFNHLQWFYGRMNYNASPFADSQGSYLKTSLRKATGTYNIANTDTIKIVAQIGDILQGMVFGTGLTAPAPLDYVMESVIPHGAGSGEMSYQQQISVQGCEVTGNVTDFILQRIAVNNSGGTIQFTELGLYGYYNASEWYLLLHDVFTAVPVLDTETLTVQLKYSITT